MSLYINEIIGKLLQTKGFEHVLEKDVNKNLPATPRGHGLQAFSRTPSSIPAASDSALRRSHVVESPAHRRITSDNASTAPVGIGGGLSRAFSFRKKPDNPIPHLRPLKLVEEQQPQPPMRSDGTVPMPRPRMHTSDEIESETSESRAAKRASWVPGWFAKAGTGSFEDK